ncbi:hypothetical protein CEXT_803761 [Caerostris extrusa]|uniref:Uncharacterized protein n=1 Tax=Caerostris extrusa TaxID=172846 RepID=A0AAV4XCY5_CAEEX|nr:hypothetical protein CEXT_803761 [Caerostris extrusa]
MLPRLPWRRSDERTLLRMERMGAGGRKGMNADRHPHTLPFYSGIRMDQGTEGGRENCHLETMEYEERGSECLDTTSPPLYFKCGREMRDGKPLHGGCILHN